LYWLRPPFEALHNTPPPRPYLPSADHKLFDNWQEYEALYGVELVTEAKAFAPEIYLSGGRAQLRSRLRSAFSPWTDRRQPFDVVRDRLEHRAEFVKTAA
jgi:hypothetical protein